MFGAILYRFPSHCFSLLWRLLCAWSSHFHGFYLIPVSSTASGPSTLAHLLPAIPVTPVPSPPLNWPLSCCGFLLYSRLSSVYIRVSSSGISVNPLITIDAVR